MWFWWFMFVCNLLIPILLIISGRMMWKHPPKSINQAVGYRTKLSMQNMDTWMFAHDFCGRLWWKLGWIMLFFSLLLQLPFYRSSENAVGTAGGILCTVQCIALIVSIFPTESALKKTFTKEGIRRQTQ